MKTTPRWTGRCGFAALDGFFILLLLSGGVFLYSLGAERGDLLAKQKKLNDEMTQIAAALTKIADESGLSEGDQVPFERYKKWLKGGGNFTKKGMDPFDREYPTQTLGSEVVANPESLAELKELDKRQN